MERVCPLTAAVTFSVCSSQIVKFCQPGQDRVSPVSDVDIGVYQLQRSEKLLGERVEKLSLEADKYISSNVNYKTLFRLSAPVRFLWLI